MEGAGSASPKGASSPSAAALRRRSPAGRAPESRSRRSLPRLLEEPGDRRDDRASRAVGWRMRSCAADRRHVQRRTDQRDRATGCAPCRATGAGKRAYSGRWRRCGARRARGSRPHGRLLRKRQERPLARSHESAHSQRRQYRHRRLRPRSGDGLRSAASLQPARPDIALHLERRRHRLCRSHARSRSRGDLVCRLFENLHDAGDSDQCPPRPCLEPAHSG